MDPSPLVADIIITENDKNGKFVSTFFWGTIRTAVVTLSALGVIKPLLETEIRVIYKEI